MHKFLFFLFVTFQSFNVLAVRVSFESKGIISHMPGGSLPFFDSSVEAGKTEYFTYDSFNTENLILSNHNGSRWDFNIDGISSIRFGNTSLSIQSTSVQLDVSSYQEQYTVWDLTIRSNPGFAENPITNNNIYDLIFPLAEGNTSNNSLEENLPNVWIQNNVYFHGVIDYAGPDIDTDWVKNQLWREIKSGRTYPDLYFGAGYYNNPTGPLGNSGAIAHHSSLGPANEADKIAFLYSVSDHGITILMLAGTLGLLFLFNCFVPRLKTAI